MLGCGKLEDLILENMKVRMRNVNRNISLRYVGRSKHDSVAQR